MTRYRIGLPLFGLFTAALLTLLIMTPTPARADINTLLPDSYTTTQGDDGGQPVTNMHVQDQSGTQDNWNKYVEFSTPSSNTYQGYRSYTLPSGISPTSITALQISTNYKGPEKSYQTWTWKIYNWNSAAWVTLGDNGAASDWVWSSLAFNAGGTISQYINSSTNEIRVRLESNNTKDNALLDYEAVTITTSSSVTNTPTLAPPTNTPTNPAVPPTATPTTMPPTSTPTAVPPTATSTTVTSSTTTVLANSYTTDSGADGGQPVTNLHVQDQSGSQNNWNKYVEFNTPGSSVYTGYRTYIVPGSVTISAITGIQVKANYLGPSQSQQTWTWQIYDWSSSSWITLGNNSSGSWSAWTLFTFNAPGVVSRYVNNSTREIRILTESSDASDDADLDYEAVILTVGGSGATSTPTAGLPTATQTAVPLTATPTGLPPTATPTTVPPTPTNIPPTSTATPAPGTCTHYVATAGNDNNAGTVNAPWRTIQKAANTVSAGSTVCVRGGTYNEAVTFAVSGTASAYTIFQSYPGETAVVDGTGLSVPASETALFMITSQSYLIIRDFELQNYKTSSSNVVPVGIRIFGTAHHIELRNNVIHNIENNRNGANGTDAHGIAVHGTSGSQAVNNVIVDGNELYNLVLGSSEALVINGNVQYWQVTNNIVHDSNNIGIDAIGFEGTASNNDQARDGLIAGNHVYNIDTYGNPAYGNDRSAGCVYVDGGTRITIENNILHNCNLGIEIASEHAGRATSYVTVRNNFVYSNTQVGLGMGGYDTKRGSTENCIVVNNTFYNNATIGDWGAELYVQYDTRNNIIKNNIFYANSNRLFIESWSPVMVNNVVDYNWYYASGGGANGSWIWQNTAYSTFGNYQNGSGNDANGFVGQDPLFVSTTTPDLHLRTGSPAIDNGQNLTEAGSVDIDGDIRIQNTIDLGADEVQ